MGYQRGSNKKVKNRYIKFKAYKNRKEEIIFRTAFGQELLKKKKFEQRKNTGIPYWQNSPCFLILYIQTNKNGLP